MHMKKILALWGVLLVFAVAQLQGAPFITSFSPKFGSTGDPNRIIIKGSGFAPGALIVKFGGPNGVRDFTAGSGDGVNIEASVPPGTPLGPGKIFVSVNGVSTESAEDFTVIGQGPYIAGFTPAAGDGGTFLTITGAHFFNGIVQAVNYGTLWVHFKGPTTNGIRTNVLSGDSVTLSFLVPEGVSSGPITVYNAKGTNVSAGSFLVPPKISGFTPTTGRAGTNVVITGTNLLGATSVQFNNLNAPDFNVLSNGAIRASVPIGATTGKIKVTSPAGSSETSSNFVVQPILATFNPASGPAGTSVTIFGANFNVGTPVVSFNGVQAAAPTGVSFGQLTAVVPSGATTGPITVTTSNGVATSAANFYLPGIITGVTPIFGSVQVTITGTNLTDATAVKFNGVDAVVFSVHNDNSIGAVVPSSVTSGRVSVTTPAGAFTNSAVKFYAPPSIGNFDPQHGLPGTNVTIFGQNFLDATSVLFNGTNAPFTVVNNTTINTVVPTNALTGPITVIAPAGTNTTPVNFVLDYSANLSVSVTDSPDPVVVTSNVVYTINIVNNGPFAAPGVTLTDTLIGPALLKSATTSQGTLTTNTFPITGALGQINVGGSVLVTLTVAAQAEGMITNIATVASLLPDPATTNNSVTNTTYVQPLPILSVRVVNTNQIRVSWPAALTNYGLQFKPLLLTTNFWSNTVTLPVLVGSEFQLTETNTEAMRYYRLRRVP